MYCRNNPLMMYFFAKNVDERTVRRVALAHHVPFETPDDYGDTFKTSEYAIVDCVRTISSGMNGTTGMLDSWMGEYGGVGGSPYEVPLDEPSLRTDMWRKFEKKHPDWSEDRKKKAVEELIRVKKRVTMPEDVKNKFQDRKDFLHEILEISKTIRLCLCTVPEEMNRQPIQVLHPEDLTISFLISFPMYALIEVNG